MKSTVYDLDNDRYKGRICAKEREDISIVERKERRDAQI